MKKIIIALALVLTSFASMADVIKAEASDSQLQILDLVVGVTQTYSQASGVEAKVVELLAGDGLNPTRMVLIVSEGLGEGSKVFELGEMMYKVNRITFSDIDTIVINFSQDSINEDGTSKEIKRSIEVKLKRDANGTLTSEADLKSLK